VVSALLKVKVPDTYKPPLTGKPEEQWFTLQMTSISSGSAAQLSTAHCLNKRTLDSQSEARQTYSCPSQPHYGLHLAMFSVNDSLFLVASIARYQLLLTYPDWPGGLKDRIGLTPLGVQKTCSRLLLSSDPGWTRTRDQWVTSPRPYHCTTEPPSLWWD